ncbi:hypothetical protein DCAR_0833125 [Daucus carota subsp. sativus]|uniref:Transmembrane protein n=1 Tax=Daucus carota subsp. sativus TaxID=79200 RepID=A0A175YS53_DAUCS|nr:PREDICTED: uncharacterized protein LOC108198739 [Daucus carota subsp. sativus]WOH13615.1 hypothetical protein DCAR_0833125 [Daucus carota subsp. sativus]
MSQPVLQVYSPPFPTQVMTRPAAAHHSHESFGTVFIVLAVIVVISAIACVLGRICSRRQGHPKGAYRSRDKEPRQNHHSQPKEGDIEFGFDKRFSSSKVAANEDFGGPNVKFGFDKRFPSGKGPANEEPRGPQAFHNGADGGEGGAQFGFDKRFPSGREATNEELRGPTTFHSAATSRGEGSIEFGFDKRFPSGKGPANEGIRGHKPIHNGQSKRVTRFAGDGN